MIFEKKKKLEEENKSLESEISLLKEKNSKLKKIIFTLIKRDEKLQNIAKKAILCISEQKTKEILYKELQLVPYDNIFQKIKKELEKINKNI